MGVWSFVFLKIKFFKVVLVNLFMRKKSWIIFVIIVIILILLTSLIIKFSVLNKNKKNICQPDYTGETENFETICLETGGEYFSPCVEAVIDPERICNACVCHKGTTCDSTLGCIN